MNLIKGFGTSAAAIGFICSIVQATIAYQHGEKALSKAYRLVAAWQFLAIVYIWCEL